MSRGTFQKKTKQKKLNKVMTLSVLFGPHINKIGTKMYQILNVTNKLPETKHSLNIKMASVCCEVMSTYARKHESINLY